MGDFLFTALFAIKIACDEKLIRPRSFYRRLETKYRGRHPHVFGRTRVRDKEEVLRVWQKKKREIFEGIPRALPALQQANLIQERAARHRFDWPALDGPLAKLAEELREIRHAVKTGNRHEISEELGDLLFSAVNVSRFLEIDPEAALRQTNRKFIRRFRQVIRQFGEQRKDLASVSLAEMDRLWESNKQRRRKSLKRKSKKEGIRSGKLH